MICFPFHFQVRDVSSNSTSDKSVNKKGDDSSQKNISESPPEYAPCRKSKKKHLKRQLKNMHIGLKLNFFRASLDMHSKKKHKRSKKRTLNAQVLCKENLLDKDCFPSDLGPSTSEKSSTISLGSIHCGKKKSANDTALKNVNNRVSSLMNTIDGEFKERIYQNGTVLATDQPVERSSGSVSEANQHNSREIDSLEDGKTGASLHWNVLTQGLGETTGLYLSKISIPAALLPHAFEIHF